MTTHSPLAVHIAVDTLKVNPRNHAITNDQNPNENSAEVVVMIRSLRVAHTRVIVRAVDRRGTEKRAVGCQETEMREAGENQNANYEEVGVMIL